VKSRLNPRVQAAIVLVLLLMLAGLVFLPLWFPQFKSDAVVSQTVLTLVTFGVQFFLGTSSNSAAKDDRAADVTSQLIGKSAEAQPQPPKENP